MARRRKASKGDDGGVPGFIELSLVGSGRLSSVFRAIDVDNHRPVALKVLDLDGIPRKAIEAFQEESLTLATLGAHPHVVTLLRTVAMTNASLVQVLELCEGSVDQTLSPDHTLDPALAVSTMVKIAGAAEAGRRAGLLHQDLTPRHIRITAFGEPALADFGLAQLHALSPRVVRTADDGMAHTPPEWLEGGDPGPAGDVYQLASTLYELVRGAPAFAPVDGESEAALTVRIIRDPAPPLFAPDLPISVADLIARCLAKDPDSRPANAGEFADALRAIEAEQGWTVTSTVLAGGGGLSVSPTPTPVPTYSPPPAAPAPERTAIGVAAVSISEPPVAIPPTMPAIPAVPPTPAPPAPLTPFTPVAATAPPARPVEPELPEMPEDEDTVVLWNVEPPTT